MVGQELKGAASPMNWARKMAGPFIGTSCGWALVRSAGTCSEQRLAGAGLERLGRLELLAARDGDPLAGLGRLQRGVEDLLVGEAVGEVGAELRAARQRLDE